MIVQCDHCNTRFKLDDAKIKPGGVKVRCSKCKEIFLVKREEPQEEPSAPPVTPPVPEAAAGLSPDAAPSPPADFPDEESLSFEQSAFTNEAPPPTEASDDSAGMSFDEFSFSDEPSAPQAEVTPPPAGESYDFGDVAFDQQATEEKPVTAAPQVAADEFDFGEMPFSEETAAVPGESAVGASTPDAEGSSLDFSNFDFNAGEPAFSPDQTEPEPTATPGFDFSFGGEESAPESDGGSRPSPVSEANGADVAGEPFGFGYVEEPVTPELSREDSSADFDQEPIMQQGVAVDGLPPALGDDFSDAFGVAGGAGPTTPPEEDQLFGFESDIPEGVGAAGATRKAAEMEPLDFGDLDFGGVAEKASPAPPKKEGVSWEMPVAATAVAAGAAGVLNAKGGTFAYDEELPPLSIASRRRGSPIVSIVLIAIAVLLVVAIGGIGFYTYQEGPSVLEKFGLGFMADWFGMETKGANVITIRNSSAKFVTNREAGELFVITGEAVNNSKKMRASIQVKVVVFGPKGEVLLQHTAYCGNTLADDQLATFPMDKIEAAMNNQFGQSLANLGVEPGKSIPFMAVFKDLPRNAGEFGVEVVTSTVASK
ncbi:MAG: hypothetical protein CXR31_12625 [Geobacter sp.]|nr:MAG: hypothetical protein CXR31_12625 [Geobacter sp.]